MNDTDIHKALKTAIIAALPGDLIGFDGGQPIDPNSNDYFIDTSFQPVTNDRNSKSAGQRTKRGLFLVNAYGPEGAANYDITQTEKLDAVTQYFIDTPPAGIAIEGITPTPAIQDGAHFMRGLSIEYTVI